MTKLKLEERKDFVRNFGKSDKSNFVIVDKMSTPHPYMITPKHLEYNNDAMYLGEPQIQEMEKSHGSMCGQRQCNLKYEEHKQALVVECKLPMTENGESLRPELQQFLLNIKKKASKHKFDGFAFVDEDGKGAKKQ